jgi:hypothetical protein
MPKGARTKADLELAVDVLKARDARRAREIKALRGDIDEIEKMLAADRAHQVVVCATVDTISSAANSTGLPSGHRAGTALDRARLFLQRLFGRRA